jgi:hypothetical protein
MKTDLTAAELKTYLHYEPLTGQFTWLVGARAGRIAGCLSPTTRYIHVKLKQYQYLAHRLAWLYCHGTWPASEIDHIDRCRSNNVLANLREATPSQNRRNGGFRSSNTSGMRGVYFDKRSGKYRADIKFDGKQTTLGHFDSIEEASRCYEAAAQRAFGEFYPGQLAAAREILAGDLT